MRSVGCAGALAVLTTSFLAAPVPVVATTVSGAAASAPTCAGQAATVVGTDHDDNLRGTGGRDVVVAGEGWDRIVTLSGNDLVCGGKGSDTVLAGAGADVVHAGTNGCIPDRTQAGAQARYECGYADHMLDGPGDDRYNGGPGLNDAVTYERSSTGVSVQLGTGDTEGIVTHDGERDRLLATEVFVGSAHNDRVIGSDGADIVGAGDGRDVVRTGAGNDFVDAGAGPDDVRTGTGADHLDLARGSADTGSGADYVGTQGPGPVRIRTGSQHDSVYVAVRAPSFVDLGTQNDRLTTTPRGEGAPVRVLGGPGDDRLSASVGSQRLQGGAGSDLVLGGQGDDNLSGGRGDDTLGGGAGHDIGDGGPQVVQDVCRSIEEMTGCEDEPDPGNRTCQGLPVTILGSPQRDNITGTSGDDVIAGRDGNDRIDGAGGNDVVCAGNGRDRLAGGEGNDRLYGGIGYEGVVDGGPGNDLLRGGPRRDDITGGPGDDDIVGFFGAGESGNPELVSGGLGNDRIEVRDESTFSVVEVSYRDAANGITVDLAAGTAAGEGIDVLVDVHRLTATPFADDITGSSGDDVILGISGSDVVDAGGGDDYVNAGNASSDDLDLSGGAGDDILLGYLGDDLLRGGSGADQLDGSLGEDVGYGGPDQDACYNFETTTGCEVDQEGRTARKRRP